MGCQRTRVERFERVQPTEPAMSERIPSDLLPSYYRRQPPRHDLSRFTKAWDRVTHLLRRANIGH
jgi:hypothetical protein